MLAPWELQVPRESWENGAGAGGNQSQPAGSPGWGGGEQSGDSPGEALLPQCLDCDAGDIHGHQTEGELLEWSRQDGSVAAQALDFRAGIHNAARPAGSSHGHSSEATTDIADAHT